MDAKLDQWMMRTFLSIITRNSVLVSVNDTTLGVQARVNNFCPGVLRNRSIKMQKEDLSVHDAVLENRQDIVLKLVQSHGKQILDHTDHDGYSGKSTNSFTEVIFI